MLEAAATVRVMSSSVTIAERDQRSDDAAVVLCGTFARFEDLVAS